MSLSRAFAAALALALAGAAAAQTTPAPGSLWSVSGVVDSTHQQEANVVDYRILSLTKVLGISDFSLDLHAFTGFSTRGAFVQGFALGKTVRIADQATGFFALGLVNTAGYDSPGVALEAGIMVQF